MLLLSLLLCVLQVGQEKASAASEGKGAWGKVIREQLVAGSCFASSIDSVGASADIGAVGAAVKADDMVSCWRGDAARHLDGWLVDLGFLCLAGR